MTEASKAAEEKPIPQLCLEIRNLAHYAWNDPENAEYLFTEIEHRADEIERHYAELTAKLTALSFILTGNDAAWMHKTGQEMVEPYRRALAEDAAQRDYPQWLHDMNNQEEPERAAQPESTPTPFGWWDTFNEHLWRTETDAAKAIEGGNHVIALYAGAAQTPGETLLGEAMLILKGLDLSVEWELAPEIKNAIHDVCVKYEGHSPAPAPQKEKL